MYTRLRDELGIEEKIITLSLRTTLPLTLSMMATSFAVGLLRPCAAIADALHENSTLQQLEWNLTLQHYRSMSSASLCARGPR